MLTPLNGIQINAILHHFPQRAQVAQVLDLTTHSVNDKVNLLVSSESTDTEPN